MDSKRIAIEKLMATSPRFRSVINSVLETLKMYDTQVADLGRIRTHLDNVSKQGELDFWLRIAARSSVDAMGTLSYRLTVLTSELDAFHREKGTYKPRPKKKKKNIADVFNELAVALESTYRMSEDEENLRVFHNAKGIRHRITHPKKLSDLAITAEEYTQVVDAHVWFQQSFSKLHQQFKYAQQPKTT